MKKDRNEDFLRFRREYPKFVYSGYTVSESTQSLGLDFHFIIPGLAEFRPHWDIRKPEDNTININDKRLNELAFSLGMVELVSYWKLTCSPEIYIECGSLSEKQIQWWKKLYKKGLGEFFYINAVEHCDDLMSFTCGGASGTEDVDGIASVDDSKVLIPIGGGKDSAVTLELLKNAAQRYCYIINPRKATLETVAASSLSDKSIIIANRTIDENLLALNKRGFLNGHTPFSALVAFSSVLAAYINGIKYVALSNESSANESTVLDSDVNHQYSKSFEFESDFVDYEKEYISSDVEFFSFLRPLTELSIAKIFSELKEYHPVFKSCNVGSKEDVWCAACPKCLFVYIILAPFLSEDEMIGIFGKNMLDDTTLTSTFDKLTGKRPEKPFECVGSREEVNAAMQELVRKYKSSRHNPPALVKYYSELDVTGKYDIAEMCGRIDNNNHVPEKFMQVLKGNLR